MADHEFFANKECKYYPCHRMEGELNCLFCYCPLYPMKNCPGTYEYKQKEDRVIKSCINCSFPHKKENYQKIVAILASIHS